MNKKRIQIIIIAVLVIVMIAAWANSIKILARRAKLKKLYPASSVTIHTPSSALHTTIEATLISKRIFKEEDLDWKRCPFSGRNYSQQESIEDFLISGIIWDEENPKTIINGEILNEGETIGGFVIEKIEKQKVILSNGTKTVELHI